MDAQVAIVGAGPAGALLSGLLSSRGIETLLIERQSSFDREFRGEFLMPSGIRALEAAGFDLSSVATETPREVAAFNNGRCFLRFRPGELDPAQDEFQSVSRSATAVSQPELLEALVSQAEQSNRFELRRGTRVRKIDVGGDGSHTLHLRSEAGDGDETLRVPFLIGCDGRGSVCRRSLSKQVETRGTALDVVWFKIPYPDNWKEPAARVALGRGHFMLVLPSADGLLQMAWVIIKGSYGDLKSRSVREWADHMSAQADPELGDHIQVHRDSLSRPFLLRAVTDRVRGWAAPGSLLIGDAAHTMSPVGAQGVNLALRDAIVTANELVPAFQNGTDVDLAAARVESLRAREIDTIQRIAAVPPRVALGQTAFHAGIRRLIAFAAPKLFAHGASGGPAGVFLNGVTDVELRV